MSNIHYIENNNDFTQFYEDNKNNTEKINLVIIDGKFDFKWVNVTNTIRVNCLIFNEHSADSSFFASNFFRCDTIIFNCEIKSLSNLCHLKTKEIYIKYEEYKKFKIETRREFLTSVNDNVKVLSEKLFNMKTLSLIEKLS